MQLISYIRYPEPLFDGYVTREYETHALFLLWDEETQAFSKQQVANWLAAALAHAELCPLANMLRLVMAEWPDDF